ncbi:hypothetical protein AB8O64_16370 [Streptomyces sp. QH1-20]
MDTRTSRRAREDTTRAVVETDPTTPLAVPSPTTASPRAGARIEAA